ncbi:2-dehydropantoate 2-reductase [Azoarcus sp. TTM-91]|uniref:ketopantoate reductase family protein n=1 Tax=Azoarcus sp. TTM-91 TaxID=2691581 RepID=UPI002006E1C6|nr:2-dehydropantoate 2-reductase [Azoarcus sp. TTM-91]
MDGNSEMGASARAHGQPGQPGQPGQDGEPYPLVIIGAGALGLSIGARLARRMAVALVASSPARAAGLRAGVQVDGSNWRPDAWSAPRLPRAEWALLLVKAGDTAAAAGAAAAMGVRGLLSLQNGLVETRLREAAPGVPLVGQGITTMGAHRNGGAVTLVGCGETLLPPGFEVLARWLDEAGFPARVEPEIAAARLAKLLVNLALNPLTAVFRVPTGALLEAPYPPYVEALVAEAWPVLRRAGLTLDEAQARERVWAVVRATAANRTSMLQDLLAGRRTELDAITGVLLHMAQAQGAEVPTHRALHRLVCLQEAAFAESRPPA